MDGSASAQLPGLEPTARIGPERVVRVADGRSETLCHSASSARSRRAGNSRSDAFCIAQRLDRLVGRDDAASGRKWPKAGQRGPPGSATGRRARSLPGQRAPHQTRNHFAGRAALAPGQLLCRGEEIVVDVEGFAWPAGDELMQRL
jgi:hypothetical protein